MLFLSQILLFLLAKFALFFKKAAIPKILLRSPNLIVLDKPYDMKINSNDKKQRTLQTFLKKEFPTLASDKLAHEFYFVHRLDFATSGVICVPTNKNSCRLISKAFQQRKTKKYYVALIRGFMSEKHIIVEVPIGEDMTSTVNQKMCTSDQPWCKYPRNAYTVVLALEKGIFDNYPATKVLIRPITGRRHQIRVHCSYLGHTIVGDYTYSNRRDLMTSRMYLHSIKLYLPTEMENFTVETEDPFTEELIPTWKVFERILSEDADPYWTIDHIIATP